jgi:hypothetical protein
MVLMAVLAIGTVPFGFVGREQVSLAGLPLWLWTSFLFTAALSAVTVWAVLRFWRDDEFE